MKTKIYIILLILLAVMGITNAQTTSSYIEGTLTPIPIK